MTEKKERRQGYVELSTESSGVGCKEGSFREAWPIWFLRVRPVCVPLCVCICVDCLW